MSERFYLEQPLEHQQAALTDAEAHHALHVMRLGVGDEVTLFDGQGSEYRAEITSTTRRSVQLEILACHKVERDTAAGLTLGVALPKGDRQRFLVEKACELGVDRIVPLITERSVARPTPATLQRARRSVIEACKQCRRNWLMEIDEPTPFRAFLERREQSSLGLLAHPGGQTLAQIVAEVAGQQAAEGLAQGEPPGQTLFAIGPEGGFSPAEFDLAAELHWRAVSLGPRILRVETAALAVAAQWMLSEPFSTER